MTERIKQLAALERRASSKRIPPHERNNMKLKPSTKPGKNRRKFSTLAAPANIQLKTLLATTDFSAAAGSGVRYAVTLAEQLGAAVTLLHVLEPPSRMAGMEGVVLVREDSDVVASARAQLATLAKRKGKGDVAVTFSVLTFPTRATTKRTRKTPAFKLKKILVPIDFSNISKVALPWATHLAAHFGAEVVLLHIVEKFPIDYLLGSGLTNETFVPLVKQAEADLEQMAGSLRKSTGPKVSAVVSDGKPYEAICEAAKTVDADLIVLTTHG